MQILPSSYANGSIVKYILFTRDEGIPVFHYTYKIYFDKGITELNKYVDNSIDSVHEINCIIPFDTSNPLSSIERFYKILILKAG